ncbi:MAG: enoyl-CoA hydratase/isomerase family protein [Pseudomonadota bacterium]
MAAYDTVLIERHGPVALVALNRPDKLNAISAQLRDELPAAFAELEADETVRVVVLAGEGRAFSAGVDLSEGATGAGVEDVLMKGFKPSLDAIARSGKPWISAIQGACAGVGAAYALACDLAVMEEDAYVYQAFAAIGLIPDGGNHWHMVQALGYKRAYAAIVGAEKLPAADCAAAGLVNRVVPTGQARKAALAWAAELAQGAPRTLRHAKTVLRQAVTATLDDTYAEEARLQADCALSKDAENAIASFFRKEKPVFTGE